MIPLLLSLAACGTPHPLSTFDRRDTADAAGFSFIVNWNAEQAEATRTGLYFSRNIAPVRAAAVQATEDVTGCRVSPNSLGGDLALVTMDLECRANQTPQPSPLTVCTGLAEPFDDTDNLLILEFECQ